MDIKGLINSHDGSGEEQKMSPGLQRGSQPLPPIPRGTHAPPQTPSSYAPAQHQQTPLYAPLSAGGSRPPQSHGLTPLQTPSGMPGQYPFPPTPVQNPAGVTPSQQYRPYSAFPATTPAGRPPSHGYDYQQASPLPSGIPPAMHTHATSSLSPTPSHHSQTSHSLRQSPRPALSHPPSQQYQYSQPSTPLAPPPLLQQRSSNYAEMNSPIHQRAYSNTSNGMFSGSPAQYHQGAGSLNESPTAYSRPSPQLRRTSEYLSQQIDRERSLSVSPKTIVPPRTSLGSRQSSQQQDSYSNRSSVQPSVAHHAGSPSHVTQLQTYDVAHGQFPNVGSEVPQPTPLSASGMPNPLNSAASYYSADSSLSSQGYSQQPAPAIQHQSQKMGMSHLLTPTSAALSTVNESSHSSASAPAPAPVPVSATGAEMPPKANIFMKPSPKPKKQTLGATQKVESSAKQVKLENGAASAQPRPQGRMDQQFTTSGSDSKNGSLAARHTPEPQPSSLKKRLAEFEPAGEPPAKQRKRKHSARPIWAKLSKHNLNFHQLQNGMTSEARLQHDQQVRAPIQTNSAQVQQANGQSNMNGDGQDPWLRNPPLDDDLIHARQVLGKWEKTFQWNTPMPDMLRVVQDWIYIQLDHLGDVGTNPEEGTIEIEAKIGTLLGEGSSDRLRLPVQSMAVLSPEYRRHHFESQMTMAEHRAMNGFLNETIKHSLVPGRVSMNYKHTRETDSFHALSAYGLSALPESLQHRRGKREPRLRTTTDTKQPDKVLARLVKIPIDSLHITNPNHPYDCRISINLEVNLDRPDIDPSTLIGGGGEALEIPRQKDRVSYKHLAYSADLTRVDRQGMNPTFELELEVDSNLLREQMRLMKQGKAHAFGDVVSGFLDNATFLMRQRPGVTG